MDAMSKWRNSEERHFLKKTVKMSKGSQGRTYMTKYKKSIGIGRIVTRNIVSFCNFKSSVMFFVTISVYHVCIENITKYL